MSSSASAKFLVCLVLLEPRSLLPDARLRPLTYCCSISKLLEEFAFLNIVLLVLSRSIQEQENVSMVSRLHSKYRSCGSSVTPRDSLWGGLHVPSQYTVKTISPCVSELVTGIRQGPRKGLSGNRELTAGLAYSRSNRFSKTFTSGAKGGTPVLVHGISPQHSSRIVKLLCNELNIRIRPQSGHRNVSPLRNLFKSFHTFR